MNAIRTGLVPALVILAALGSALWYFLAAGSDGGGGASSRGGPSATPVVVAQVVRAPFLDTLQAVGTTMADESVEITASVADRVRSISFDEGELATAGQVLVRLDTSEEEAELAEALANLDDQRRQFERLDQLVATNSAALSQRDEQRARMVGASARVDVIRARIADREIRAPFAGVLGLREVSRGALLTPGARITTLDDIETLRLDFSIPENFLSVLEPGALIRGHTVAYRGRVFEGRVAHISPRVDPVTRSIAIRADLMNADLALRPGMLMSVDLVKDRRESMMVPESALIPQGDRQYLFKIVDGLAQRVEVSIGARRPGIVEIVGGLAVGDTVVVEGAIRLRPGGAVNVQREVDALALVIDGIGPPAELEPDALAEAPEEDAGTGTSGGAGR